MIRKLLLIFLFLLPGLLLAQEDTEMRVVEGTMYDEYGKAIPGVNVVIQNTKIGTVTDLNGYYRIEAPLGSIVVFSFVGYTSQAVEVTRNNSRPVSGVEKIDRNEDNKELKKSIDFTQWQKQKGVVVMHDSMPKAIRKFDNPRLRAFNISFQPPTLASIFHGEKGKNGVYILSVPSRKRKEMQFTYNTAFEINQASRLPLLQNEFAQGQPLNGELSWQGPHQQEIFSWGPAITNQEYDGSAYIYHPQGQLVSQGAGNGSPANVYNPLNFFRNGNYWKNNLGFKFNNHPLDLSTNLGFNTRQGILPGNGDENYFGNLFLEYDQYFGNFKVNAAASNQKQWGPQGFNRLKTFGTVYRTPATFNNEYGFQLPDGSLISHAPAVVDNPFGMATYIPDRRKNQNANIGLNSDFRINTYGAGTIRLNANGSYNYNFDDFVMGIPPFSPIIFNGWLTQRQLENNTYATSLTASYTPFDYDFGLKIKLRYQYEANDSRLKREDGVSFENDYQLPQAQVQSIDTFQIIREIHQINFGTEIILKSGYSNLVKIIYNQHAYSSTTLAEDKDIYWLPAITSNLYIDEILDQVFYVSGGKIGDININAGYSRSVKEAPIIYNRWHFQGLQTPLADYQQIIERDEIFFQSGLAPEIIHKFDLGLNYVKGPLAIDLEYFENTTENFLLPVWNGSDIKLQNVGTIFNPGWNISLQYQLGNNFQFNYIPKISWQRNRPRVQSAIQGTLPIAGFDNTFTAISEGQPLGAIYGTTYQRSANGEILIGDDGFPLENEVPAYLGNPNPDFTMNFSNQFDIGAFKIDWVLEWRKGGSVWNGTRAYLDYLGRSQATADLRTTSGYIFTGTKADNSVNSQPVDFANPDQPLSDNRWVRYGADGVGEDYVSEVSWLRLSKLLIGYEFNYPEHALVNQLTVTFYANNLFFKSNYEGIAPLNNWMNDVAGQGLDFFNNPMIRTFGISTTLKF